MGICASETPGTTKYAGNADSESVQEWKPRVIKNMDQEGKSGRGRKGGKWREGGRGEEEEMRSKDR